MSAALENIATSGAKICEPAPAQVSHPAKAESKNILVVDDDPQIRESLAKVLRGEGYAVTLAADEPEAIEKFNASRTDLILLDLNLPGNSGWDAFGTLTADDPLVPIIIITGRQNQSELAAAIGVSAFMEKPLNVGLLLEMVADLLAEEPDRRLKRLVGLRSDMRHIPPSSGRPSVSKRSKSSEPALEATRRRTGAR